MGQSAKLFFDGNSESETLLNRISLSKEQISEAIEKKNKLLNLIKPELSLSMNIEVKHWLQGSYKNNTLIRPVEKEHEFDIDVGIYLLCNAEDEGLSALDAKELNRKVLKWYVGHSPEAKVEKTKNSCERLSYPSSFHLDIPLYFYDKDLEICKLATQNNGWIDSDPKALQDWFDNKVGNLGSEKIAKLRRIIKYLKVWTALKGKDDGIKIPSIAITILVAYYFVDSLEEDDTFINTTIQIMDYILTNDTLKNPVQKGDLFNFKEEELTSIRKKASALKKSCKFISTTKDSFQQYILWTATFEHMIPPFISREQVVSKTTNLPSITIPPKIKIRHLNKSKKQLCNEVKDNIKTFRDENLFFSIDNTHEYSDSAEVHWMVKNQGDEAKRLNDLGHKTILSKNDEQNESSSYTGIHYMECLILDKGEIKGISAVKVDISGFNRPLRNPAKRKYLKG